MKKNEILQTAFLIRRTEEKLLELFAQGALHGTVHTCIGQEMVGACLAPSVRDDDVFFSNHRGHGHFLALTGDLDGLLGEIMGRECGVLRGVGGSQHLQKKNFFSNGIQGGIVPLATGAAWAAKLAGRKSLSVAFIGDGTLGEGALYESLNVAAKWELPLLIVQEDNGVAQSTDAATTFAGDLKKRIEGFGVEFREGDTWSWEKLAEQFADAAQSVRTRGGPVFFRVQTYRLRAHSKGDDLRDPKTLESYFQKDPLEKLLREKDPLALTLDQAAKNSLEQSLARVLKSPPPRNGRGPSLPERSWKSAVPAAEKKYLAAMNEAFKKIMTANKSLLFLGEDVEDPYGGCFKVSQGLSSANPGRVRNTPISEAAIAGLATGAALRGHPSIAEFMFGDFSFLAFDQIANHAAKFSRMYPELPLPVFFRTPMGGGRGYGPTHSQNLEKHFLGIPGLDVFVLNRFVDPDEFFSFLTSQRKSPALIAENKLLYGQDLAANLPAPWKMERDERRGDIRLFTGAGAPAPIVLVGHGSQADVLFAAARKLRDEFEIGADCFFPVQHSNYRIEMDHDWFARAECLLAFEEGNDYASFSAEFAAQANAAGLECRRWGPPADIVPSAPSLEAEFRLTEEQVIAEVLEVLS